MNQPVAPSRRFGLRFSLRTLLIAMALVAISLAGFVRWRNAKLRERAASDGVMDLGGSSNEVRMKGAWVQLLAMVMPSESLQTTTYAYFPPRTTDDDLALLADQPNMEDLHIESCPRVTAAGLVHLRGLHRLQVLYLKETAVGDAGLAHLRDMRQLKELWIEDIGLSDASVPWIAQQRGLTHLNLAANDISDVSLPLIAKLENLEVLALRDTKVTSHGMAAIAHMPALKHLYLMRTAIDDTGLQHLESLPQLRTIGVQLTQVTEAGLARFKQAKPDIRFD